METIEIKCPCCKTMIVVNKENGHILHNEEDKKGPAEFDSFLQKQKSRSEDLKRKFEESKDKSRTRLQSIDCLLYTSPSPRDRTRSRMPSSA